MEAKWFQVLAAGLGAVISYLYGGMFAMLGVLGMFVVFDYASGMAAAAKEGKLSSSVGMVGIAKKLGIFMLVSVGNLVDRSTGAGHMVRDGAAWFYCANELLSIVENAGRLGIAIPPVVKQAVAMLQGKAGANTEVTSRE